MNVQDPTLPTRKVVEELIRKYDKVEPFDNDDHHWMVNVLHALNDDPEYQAYQDKLDQSDQPVIEEVPEPPGPGDDQPAYQEPRP